MWVLSCVVPHLLSGLSAFCFFWYQSQSEDLISRAEMLADIHVRSLPTKVLLKQRAAERVPGSTAVSAFCLMRACVYVCACMCMCVR